MNGFARGVKNAFRNKVRTISIILILGLSIGLALSMLIAHQAVGNKIASIKSAVGNTITIAPAGFTAASSVNNALTGEDIDKVTGLAHITGVTKTLSDRLPTEGSEQPSGPLGQSMSDSGATISLTSPIEVSVNGKGGSDDGPRIMIMGGGRLPENFTPPVEVLGTTDPAHLNGSKITITDGETIDGSKDTNEALVSKKMAEKNNLKVGSTFTAYGQTLTVAGIFESDTTRGDGTVIVSLPALQRISEQAGVVTNAVATVDSLDNLASATSAVKDALGDLADVQSSQDQADQTVEPLESIRSVALFSLIGAVAAGAMIVLMTMIMIVRERRREIGVLKAIGASNVKVAQQFTAEAVTLTVLAMFVGLLIATFAAQPLTSMLATSSEPSAGPSKMGGGGMRTISSGGGAFIKGLQDISAQIDWTIILYGFGAALIIAVAGSIATTLFIAKVRPAEVMRTE